MIAWRVNMCILNLFQNIHSVPLSEFLRYEISFNIWFLFCRGQAVFLSSWQFVIGWTIINVQSAQITTDFNWKPWTNTVMYFPFETDQVDKVWIASIPLSWTKQTLWYRFSSWSSMIAFSNVSTELRFISFRMQFNSYSWAWWIQTPHTYYWDINYSFVHNDNNYLKKFWILYWRSWTTNQWSPFWTTYNWSYNTRIYFAFWRDWTTAKAYINWQLNWSITKTALPPLSWTAFISANMTWTYSKLIWEKTPRSESDIIKYYNKTKSLYGH